jgi:hypothetical protein
MATTSDTHPGNGSNKLFSITFPYLETSDIDVYLNGILQTITTHYTFANATTVEFVAAPANGAVILLDRNTNDSDASATFFPGSSIKAADLNDNFKQVLFLAQETNNNVANAVAGQIPDGTITSAKIADGAIVNAHVNASAGIVATKLAFTQSGAGATVRTVDSKLKDIISVKDFGAVGDGVADDTTAWNNFKASRSGRKLITAGTYKISGVNRVFPNDALEDNIQRFPPGWTGLGTETRSSEISYISQKAAFHVGTSDTVALDDQRNYWRRLPSGGTSNAWGDVSLSGIGSAAFGRNGVAFGTYSTTFGHDCISYGVAGLAGGAGSCAGDPDGLIASDGYCSIAFGRNVLAAGSKSAAFCEESEAKGRASLAAGYSATATTNSDSGLGAIALGRDVIARGDDTSVFGAYLDATGGTVLLGRGANAGSKMTSTSGGVGLGARVLTPTLEVTPGNGSGGQGGLVYRSATQLYCPHVISAGLAQTTQTLTNSGSGGYGEFHIRPLSAGALVDGWTVDSGRTLGIVSLYPLVDATMRLGSASYRPEYIFAVNGTIQTSDRREKQDIKELSEKELAVATRLKALIRTFRWKKSVAEKGDKARIHVGVIAQDVRDAFTQEGLDADSYSIFCYDKWDEISEVKDSDGNVTEPYRPAGDRYGVKYDALLAFIIAAL